LTLSNRTGAPTTGLPASIGVRWKFPRLLLIASADPWFSLFLSPVKKEDRPGEAAW